VNLRAAACRFGRQRKPHAPAGSIADVSHRVEVLEGRPGGNQDPPAGQRLRPAEQRAGCPHDVLGLGKASLSGPPAREEPLGGFDHVDAARAEPLEVPLDCLVVPHVRVHRWRDQDGRPRGQVERGQEIVRETRGEPGHDVGGCGGDEQQVNRRGQRDVRDVGVGARLELVGDHAAPRDCLERQRPYEAGCRLGHDGHDLVPGLLQSPRDLDRLVRANPARYAESHE
jgi:hypothetical protein